MSEKCSWCEKGVEDYYWQNLVKGFCSLECTNEYLWSEGFEPIDGPKQSSSVRFETLNPELKG